jgi:hypothetical protein
MVANRRLVILLSAWIAAPALAQDARERLMACRAETDDTRRLACYDREMGREQESASAAADPPPAPASAEERFGRERAIAQREAERAREESRQLGSLEAVVTDIRRRADGLMTLTLDNGQVWQQNRPDSMFRLEEGDPVVIQPGALKSYILSGPSKRSTRVSRVK